MAIVTETSHHISPTTSQDPRAWLPGRVFCLTGRERENSLPPGQFVRPDPHQQRCQDLKSFNRQQREGGKNGRGLGGEGGGVQEVWDLPSLLPEKFPSSHPEMGSLAPGCRPEVTSAPSQPGTPPNQHLAQADPHPRHCHRGVCAEGLGEAKQLFWWAQLPTGGERRSCSSTPRPRARPCARPLHRSAPRGDWSLPEPRA